MAKDVRVEIGFVGGGNTAIGVPEGDLENFRSALLTGASEPWFSTTSTDGAEFLVDLSKVVFVRVAATNRTIGFSHA